MGLTLKQKIFGIRPTIAQLQKLVKLAEKVTPEDTILEKLFYEADFAGILTNRTEEEGRELTKKQVYEIQGAYRKPLGYKEVQSVRRRFNIGSRVFKMVPDYENFNAGQHISFNEWTKSDKTVDENLHNLAALCCVEYKFPYLSRRKETTKEFYKRAEFFRDNCPAEIAYQLAGFFLQTQIEFLKTISKQ